MEIILSERQNRLFDKMNRSWYFNATNEIVIGRSQVHVAVLKVTRTRISNKNTEDEKQVLTMIFASLKNRASGELECHEFTIFPFQSTSTMTEYFGRAGNSNSKLIT